MIKFSTVAWDWDLTNFGLTFTEENDYFTETTTKSYSFPTSVKLTQEISEKLGLVEFEGATDYASKIYGTLQIDNTFYDAYLSINEIEDDTAEITFFYGKETLSVFDKKLKDLPFPVTIATPDLNTFALSQLDTAWPTATHQFVKVFRDDLSSKSNYKHFEYFLNNTKYDDIEEEWYFQENANETIDEEVVAVNKNVMVPMTYLLEVLKVGFKSEGLEIRGQMVQNEFIKKLLLVPQNFMEQFASSQYLNYSFSAYTSQTQVNGQTINIYKQSHTPTNVGSFELKIRINMSSLMAQYFKLTVVQDGVTLYEAFSENATVVINETLDINIINTNIFNDIDVELHLVQQSESIASYNHFTYEYKEGQLNIFPTVYTIADYLPDLTFREFFNRIKSWLNLDVIYSDNAVYLDFLENNLPNFTFKNRSHLQDTKPKRITNTNNLFKLHYPNDEFVLVNKTGQTYNESDFNTSEISTIPFELQPLQVRDNYNIVTAMYPEDEEDIMLILYNGTIAGENLAIQSYNNQTLTAQDVYNHFWKLWLQFRANAETVKDNFKMHYTEAINIKEGEYKYNTKRLIVSIRKQRLSTEWYNVEMTAETF
ncbi:hypothetical protein [Winogradskyella pulchriflava]|uniref:Uncharacterized protein n=1 Tax=Winogradskyella pulchriflava TaxID=1110688 RepID=A0ABV6QC49_9FLAO